MNKLKKQLKMNYENMMKIDEKYQDLVTNIVTYIRVELNSVDAEEAINDVNDILLGAQSRGEDLNEVVGEYREFCKDIIGAYMGDDKWYSLKGYIYDFGGMAIYMLVFFIALDIISSIPTIKPLTLSNILNMSYTISLAPIISCIIALVFSIGTTKYMCTNTKESIKESNKEFIRAVIVYSIVIAIMVASSFLFKNIRIYTFSNTPILIIIGILICLVGIANFIFNLLKLKRMDKVANRF